MQKLDSTAPHFARSRIKNLVYMLDARFDIWSVPSLSRTRAKAGCDLAARR